MDSNQNKVRYKLVIHEHPDVDAFAAPYLWLLAHNINWRIDSDKYELKFVPPGGRLDDEDEYTIHFDTGMRSDERNFDHHQLNDLTISATGLVWRRFFVTKDNPAADLLAVVVNANDNGLQPVSEDGFVHNLRGLTFCYNGEKKVLSSLMSDNNQRHTELTKFGFRLLDGYFLSYQEAENSKVRVSKSPRVTTKLGTTIVSQVEIDAKSIRYFLRANHNGFKNDLIHCLVAEHTGPERLKYGVTITYDRSSYIGERGVENGGVQADTRRLMFQLHERLLRIDPNADTFIHDTGFCLYVFESDIIKFKDVLNCIDELEETPRQASREHAPSAQRWG